MLFTVDFIVDFLFRDFQIENKKKIRQQNKEKKYEKGSGERERERERTKHRNEIQLCLEFALESTSHTHRGTRHNTSPQEKERKTKFARIP